MAEQTPSGRLSRDDSHLEIESNSKRRKSTSSSVTWADCCTDNQSRLSIQSAVSQPDRNLDASEDTHQSPESTQPISTEGTELVNVDSKRASVSQQKVLPIKDKGDTATTSPNESQTQLDAAILQSLMVTTQNTANVSRQNEEMNRNFIVYQQNVTEQFKDVDSRLSANQKQQEDLQYTANKLAESLKAALNHLEQSRVKHEDVIQRNDQTVANLIQHSQVLWDRNRALEEKHEQYMTATTMHGQTMNQQTGVLFNDQQQCKSELDEQNARMLKLQKDIGRLKEENRDRSADRPNPTPVLGPSHVQRLKDQYQAACGSNQVPNQYMTESWPPIQHGKRTRPERGHEQAFPGNESYEPPRMYYPSCFRCQEESPRYESGFHPNGGKGFNTIPDPGRITSDAKGYDPMPSMCYPNMMIDPCPPFTPNMYQNWKREVKLWVAGQPGATVTQILAKLIHVLPLATKTEALTYMESTERCPEGRTVNQIMELMDARYARTDSERACSWLNAFTEFKRESNENYKDFWARFNRCTAKLAALGMAMTDQVIFNRAIQALRVPEGQLPIILSALETRPDRFSIDSLKDITIRMYETHRPKIDSTEVFVTDHGQDTVQSSYIDSNVADELESDDGWNESMAVTMDDGSVFLMKPKKPTKARNAPGIHESARRGAVNTFRSIPNQKGKGVCIRCGDPSHHWRECPHPFRERLDSRFSIKGTGKGKGKGKGTFLAEAVEPGSGEDNTTENQGEATVHPAPEPTTSGTGLNGEEPAEPVTQASINDVWAQYYTRYHDSPNMIGVCNTYTSAASLEVLQRQRPESRNTVTVMHAQGRDSSTHRPPILIDSGASSSVVGKKWLESWGNYTIPTLRPSPKQFHFGDGPACPSLGEYEMLIKIPRESTNQTESQIMTVRVDVVQAVVPLLVAQPALKRMAGKIDFSTLRLELPSKLVIQLIQSPSGHILLPGTPVMQFTSEENCINPERAYPVSQQENTQLRKLTDLQVKKIHLQLGHCSQRQLSELLKFAGCKVDQNQILRIHQQCGCNRMVHRVTPPVVSSWIARFSGEVVAIDIIYPFTEFGVDSHRPGKARIPSMPALLVVDSLTRFITCSLLTDLTSETVSQAFLRDWVMPFGKPKRIILDQGGPGLTGTEWGKLSHVFGWQFIKAPTRASYQNGLAERSVRSLKAAIQSIALNDGILNLTQEVITLAVIAKNHSPHAVTGLPPAFAMTGRCDVTSGATTCMWEHDPMSHDSLIPQTNALRKILDARNAILKADSENAVRLCLTHNLPDGKGEFFPIGASVQIAVDKQWIGTFRVIAHSAGNLLVERGNKILKWPRCRTRLVNQEDKDPMDTVPMQPRVTRNLRDGWRTEEGLDDNQPINVDLSDVEMDESGIVNIDVNDAPIIEEELIRGNQSDVQREAVNLTIVQEDEWDNGVIWNALTAGQQRPQGTYVNHGTILCEDFAETPSKQLLDHTHSSYYLMESSPHLVEPHPGSTEWMTDMKESVIHQTFLQAKKQEYSDEDILESFDPSRIPPRIAFRLPPAREAIEKEVTDLLTPKPNEPPAMVEVALNDSRYSRVPRVQSTLVIKRKGANHYKGRLCVRGDTVSLNTTAFISSPTVHRCGVKVICALAAQLNWTIHAVDISQAFLQSSNLNPKDRVIVLPPAMIQLPWKGKLPPSHVDVNHLPRHTRGFLLIRPLYGGRDAPMRWFIALSERLRQHGFIQLKTDVCMFNKFDSQGNLIGMLIAHVDDLLFCGTERFRKEAITAIQTFRTGEVETLTQKQHIIFTGLLIELTSERKIHLSQQHYADEMQHMNIDSYIDSTRVLQPALLKSTFKQGLGSLIWLHQTRPDIGFTITQIATQIVEACESPTKARILANLYNKIVKFVKNHQRKITYAPFPGCESGGIEALMSMIQWKLIVFTDAGFGTLTKNHSIESHVLVLGDVLERDGLIQCHGLMLDHRCAKIHRVCRSTLSAEAHAAVTAVDAALWTQVLMIEIFTGRYEHTRLTPPTEFPIQDPFNEAPSNQEVKRETQYDHLIALSTMMHTANPLCTPRVEWFEAHCHSCKETCRLSTFNLEELERFDSFAAEEVKKLPAILFHPLVLTDCCSLYSSMLRLQPKTTERCTRITLGFLRDSMKLVAFSFIDAGVNIGDVGTKHAGSLGILDRYLATCRFTLSFLGRKQRRALK